jgi:3-hydroxyisobutyrate dehydrogenase-like beta-hydroxyacid dehydrogenase
MKHDIIGPAIGRQSVSSDHAAERRIGVIGLGTMGGPIAVGLVEGGRQVVGFDPDAAARHRCADRGVPTVESVDEVACDVAVLSLPTPTVVRAVVDALCAGAAPPVVLDTSTIDPDTAVACRERLLAAGGDYADCPVLGRPANVGTWTIPVGGSDGLAEIAGWALGPVARRVVPVGATGAAATVKILNNLMLGVINGVTAEVLVLAAAAGLDPGTFVDTVVDSGAASVSGLFRDVAPRAVDGDFTPTFSLGLMRKDNGLALDLAARLGVPLPVGTAAQTLNTMAVSSGLGDEDSIAVVKMLEQVTGHSARRRAVPPEV